MDKLAKRLAKVKTRLRKKYRLYKNIEQSLLVEKSRYVAVKPTDIDLRVCASFSYIHVCVAFIAALLRAKETFNTAARPPIVFLSSTRGVLKRGKCSTWGSKLVLSQK